jgi:hypothetical protein
MQYCQANGLPPLTVLVVNEGRGAPGSGLTTVPVQNVDQEGEKVYVYRWFELKPVETEDLEPYK